jgi:hypothetical protein
MKRGRRITFSKAKFQLLTVYTFCDAICGDTATRSGNIAFYKVFKDGGDASSGFF